MMASSSSSIFLKTFLLAFPIRHHVVMGLLVLRPMASRSVYRPPSFVATSSRAARPSCFLNHPCPTTTTTTAIIRHLTTSNETIEQPQQEDDGTDDHDGLQKAFKAGDKIQVEVISFGPLGASVEVVGRSHDPDALIPQNAPALGRGLILQQEIRYFRERRNMVDVVRGEVLPAFVEHVRDDGRIDIGLRPYGGKAKADSVSQQILQRLEQSPDGILALGDKSDPQAIAQEFPGISKSNFKKAVSALYKQGKVQPGPESIRLVQGEIGQDGSSST